MTTESPMPNEARIRAREHGIVPRQIGAAFLAGMLFSGQASALDLAEAYRLAVVGNAEYLVAQATAEAAREVLPQARAGLLPQISASANRTRNDADQTSKNFVGGEVSNRYDYFSEGKSLNVRQPLIRLANVASYLQAGAQVAAAEATLEKDAQALVIRVAAAYFDTITAKERLDTVRAQKDAYAAQLTAAERGLQAGVATRTDIDEARARLDMSSAQEIEAIQNVDVTERTLAGVLNRRVAAGELAPIDAGRLQLSPPQPAGIEAWLALAEELNPELRALRSGVEVAQREVDKGRAAHLPTLDVVASRTFSNAENSANILSNYWTTAIGVQLNIPLYSGGQVNSVVRQAQANLERARQQFEAGRRQLEVGLAKEFSAVTQGVARVLALQQAQRSAEQALISTRKGVLAGTRNSVDVLNALQLLATARFELAQARAAYALARLRLKAAAGNLGESDVTEINAWLVPATKPLGGQARNAAAVETPAES